MRLIKSYLSLLRRQLPWRGAYETGYRLQLKILETLNGPESVLTVTEGGKTEVAFATGAESGAGGTDDVCLGEELVEEIPAGHIVGSLEPDVRSVDTAEAGETGRSKTLADDAGVLHVVANELLYLSLTFLSIDGSGTALDDVGSAVELGGVATVPKGTEVAGFAVLGVGHQLLGDYGVAATGTGEAGGLTEGTELDGYLSGTFDFVDGAGNIVLGDVCSISAVVEDDSLFLAGVGYPCLKLLPGESGTGRIVGGAEVNHVYMTLRHGGGEAAFGGAGEIGNAGEVTVGTKLAGTTCHNISIEINRVNRIGDSYNIVKTENFLNVGTVALGAIADEDFVAVYFETAAGVVGLADQYHQ